MLQNAYFFAKIGADTAENEQHFAEILPIGRCVAGLCCWTRLLRGRPDGGAPRRLRGRIPVRGGTNFSPPSFSLNQFGVKFIKL